MKTCKKCGSSDFYVSGKCKQCAMEYSRTYASLNPEKVKIRKLKYRTDNPEKHRAAFSRWAKNNPDKVREKNNKYCRNNPEKERIKNSNKRARKLLNGGVLSKGLSEKLFRMQKGKCPCCNKPLGENYHMDHKMPLALGGGNTDSNMQLLTATCNLKKGAKHPVEFMQERGFLI